MGRRWICLEEVRWHAGIVYDQSSGIFLIQAGASINRSATGRQSTVPLLPRPSPERSCIASGVEAVLSAISIIALIAGRACFHFIVVSGFGLLWSSLLALVLLYSFSIHLVSRLKKSRLRLLFRLLLGLQKAHHTKNLRLGLLSAIAY